MGATVTDIKASIFYYASANVDCPFDHPLPMLWTQYFTKEWTDFARVVARSSMKRSTSGLVRGSGGQRSRYRKPRHIPWNWKHLTDRLSENWNIYDLKVFITYFKRGMCMCLIVLRFSMVYLSSNRSHVSYDDCLEDKREHYQNCSVYHNRPKSWALTWAVTVGFVLFVCFSACVYLTRASSFVSRLVCFVYFLLRCEFYCLQQYNRVPGKSRLRRETMYAVGRYLLTYCGYSACIHRACSIMDVFTTVCCSPEHCSSAFDISTQVFL